MKTLLSSLAIALWSGIAMAAPAQVVVINDKAFEPAVVTIHVGDTVQWRNDDGANHTVTADPDEADADTAFALPAGAAPFNSGKIRTDETWEYTFTVAGTYGYFCIPHQPHMAAQVVVLP